jgi:hypothetical protein
LTSFGNPASSSSSSTAAAAVATAPAAEAGDQATSRRPATADACLLHVTGLTVQQLMCHCAAVKAAAATAAASAQGVEIRSASIGSKHIRECGKQ